jgi:hypothetical protein
LERSGGKQHTEDNRDEDHDHQEVERQNPPVAHWPGGSAVRLRLVDFAHICLTSDSTKLRKSKAAANSIGGGFVEGIAQ